MAHSSFKAVIICLIQAKDFPGPCVLASLLHTRSPFIHNGAAWDHSAPAQTLLWLKLGSFYAFCINARTFYKRNIHGKERRIFSVASVAISWNHADEPLCYTLQRFGVGSADSYLPLPSLWVIAINIPLAKKRTSRGSYKDSLLYTASWSVKETKI